MFNQDVSGRAEDNKETSVVFLQSSPLSQPYWQAASVSVGEDSSAASSLCGTPTLQRRSSRHGSNANLGLLQGSTKNNKEILKASLPRSRPSSLLLEEQLKMEKSTPPSSPKNSISFKTNEIELARPKSSSSLLSNLSSSLKKKKQNDVKDIAPALLITPVSSVEKLHRLKDKLLRKPSSGNEVAMNMDHIQTEILSDDDESTPLVSETQTPIHSRDDESDYGLYFKAKEFPVNSNTTSTEVSPSSIKSTPEKIDTGGPKSFLSFEFENNNIVVEEIESNSSSEPSISHLLERSKSSESVISCRSQFGSKDIHSVSDIDLKVTTKSGSSPPLEQQNDFQRESRIKIDWDSPETSV